MAGFTEACGPRVGDPLPEDLQPIRAKLLQMFDVPARFDWIHQLELIDTVGRHEWITSADKAETLARAIEASAADLRSVALELNGLLTSYRMSEPTKHQTR